MRAWLAWQPGGGEPPPATVQDDLCGICPKRTACRALFDAPVIVPLPLPPSLPPQLASPPPQLGPKVAEVLASYGLRVEYLDEIAGPAFVRVRVRPCAGVTVAKLMRLGHDLQVQLETPRPPLIGPQAGHVSIDLARTDRQVVRLSEHVADQHLPAMAPVAVPIGIGLDGRLVEADLADPNTCHFLVGGTTGSGKSEFLKAMLLALARRHGPEDVGLILVDPKRVTFGDFAASPLLYRPMAKDTDAAIALMQDLVAEMDKRYHLFEKTGCADLVGYHRRGAGRLRRLVCVFDEYADFMADKAIRGELEQAIKRLGAMARAAGIHLVIATQRPSADVVTPVIRSNLPGRVALRTASEADSQIVLGGKETGAAHLLGKGDLLYSGGRGIQRLQGLLP